MPARRLRIIALLAGASPCAAQPDWAASEAPILTDAVQLTSRDEFVKAGEQYFSADGDWIIFQAVRVPAEGEAPSPHYAMYVAKLARDAEGRITGTETPVLVSAPGSANTCGWFHPTRAGEIMFGSTLVPPTTESGPGYQRLGGKYAWQFPHEMEVVTRRVAAAGAADDSEAKPLFSSPGYDAEGSYSPDGRYVLYAHVDEERSAQIGRPDADLYVYDTTTGARTPLVTEKGYDGGPFFSPDMSWICYRSDRFGDGNLQLFVAELDYNAAGEIEGIRREVQLTSNEHVNWAPYFHPSGRFLVYTTSELGHTNYEVFAIEFDPEKPMEDLWKTRVTHADGFDGLPVFSRDGKWMIWCAQRGELAEGEDRPSSQVWAARFDAEALLGQVEGGGF
ncbi:MAG TPA: hypothetical protein VFF69_15450 [Phycisphaerales bacterium]|nr:hypothetical protein [Phycisphaerales bacterium]